MRNNKGQFIKGYNEIELKSDYAIIKVFYKNRELKVLIDKDDVEKVISKGKWFCNPAHAKRVKSFIPYIYDNHSLALHRFITNCPKGMTVDHINHNPLDNRKSNLRICTHRDNCRNTSVLPNSGYHNIRLTKYNKYQVRININGKEHTKNFNTISEALSYRNSLI